jgi:Na+/melibiose symporter-like transporter
MSTITLNPGRSTFTAIGTCVASAALVTFAAYGDPHPEKGQEAAVPFLIAISCVTAAIAFGLLVPRMVDTVGGRRWALGAGVVAAIATPVVFWAGAPLALGVAAVVGGRRSGSRAAVVLGVIAVAGSVLMTVVGNTILTKS